MKTLSLCTLFSVLLFAAFFFNAQPEDPGRYITHLLAGIVLLEFALLILLWRHNDGGGDLTFLAIALGAGIATLAIGWEFYQLAFSAGDFDLLDAAFTCAPSALAAGLYVLGRSCAGISVSARALPLLLVAGLIISTLPSCRTLRNTDPSEGEIFSLPSPAFESAKSGLIESIPDSLIEPSVIQDRELELIEAATEARSRGRFSGRIAELGAAIVDRLDFGLGVTKSTDGWWYAGLKLRGKPAKGSDALDHDEGEIPFNGRFPEPVPLPQK